MRKLKEQLKLVEKYVDLETKIIDDLDKRKNANKECTCNNPISFAFVNEGDTTELCKRCLKCGGYLE